MSLVRRGVSRIKVLIIVLLLLIGLLVMSPVGTYLLGSVSSGGQDTCSFKILNVNIGFNGEVQVHLKNTGQPVPYSKISNPNRWEVYLDGKSCNVNGLINSGDTWESQGVLTLLCKCEGVSPSSQYTVSVRIGGSSDNYVYVGS